jgi:hypothetical protein
LLTIALVIPTDEIPAAAMAYVKGATAVTYGTFGATIAGLNAFGQQLAMASRTVDTNSTVHSPSHRVPTSPDG